MQIVQFKYEFCCSGCNIEIYTIYWEVGHQYNSHRVSDVYTPSLEQVVSLDAQNIVAVSCGEAHTLALNDKGQVFAWGLGSDGQLGLSNLEDCLRVPR